MSNRGGRIYPTTGQYDIGSPVVIDRSHVAFTGPGKGFWESFNSANPGTGDEGQGLAKINLTADINAIRIADDAFDGGRNDASTLEGFYVYGNGHTGTAYAVTVENAADQCTISDILIHNTAKGVLADGDACQYTNVSVMDVGGVGFRVPYLQQSFFNSTAYDIVGNGFELRNRGKCRLVGCAVARADTGIDVGSQKNTISGCDIALCRSDGISITAPENNVTGLSVRDCTGRGVVSDASLNNISGRVKDSGSDGVKLGTNNTFVGNSSDNSGDGIIVTDTNSVHATAANNTGNGFYLANTRSTVVGTAAGNSIGFYVSGDNNLIIGQANFNTTGIELDGNQNVAHVNLTSNSNGIIDNGLRNVINGYGTNAGDPSTTGEWNGNASFAHRVGALVWDTTTTPETAYRATPSGSWVTL
jgi:hypothetical protein